MDDSKPHLLCVNGIVGQLGQMDELQVQGPELSQDAAPGRRPAPTPTGATATEAEHTNKTKYLCMHTR